MSFVKNINGYEIKGTPDYSTSEVNTGVKWIDDSEIYRIVVNTGDLSDSSRYDEYSDINIDLSVTEDITPISIIGIGGDGNYWNNIEGHILMPNDDLEYVNLTLTTTGTNRNILTISAIGGVPNLLTQSYVIIDYIKVDSHVL